MNFFLVHDQVFYWQRFCFKLWRILVFCVYKFPLQLILSDMPVWFHHSVDFFLSCYLSIFLETGCDSPKMQVGFLNPLSAFPLFQLLNCYVCSDSLIWIQDIRPFRHGHNTISCSCSRSNSWRAICCRRYGDTFAAMLLLSSSLWAVPRRFCQPFIFPLKTWRFSASVGSQSFLFSILYDSSSLAFPQGSPALHKRCYRMTVSLRLGTVWDTDFLGTVLLFLCILLISGSNS